MSVDPTIEADPLRSAGHALPQRRYATGRQKVAVGITCLVVASAAVLFSQLLDRHHKVEHPAAGGVSAGLQWQPPEEAAAPPLPMPMAAPRIPSMKTASAPAQSTSDAALDAPIFSTAGSVFDSANGGQVRRGMAKDRDRDDAFSAMLRPSGVGATARARRMPHPSLTLPAGIVIPCTLQTAINSQLMGFVDCVMPKEARSADGTVALLDKGTQIVGQIRSGLRDGQDRLFILWTRARTPDNVTVDLSSPASDELGRAGVPGAVDNHFWQRFGAALLFSVIESGPQLAASALQNSGNNGITSNTNIFQPQQQLANTILKDTINIPPTLERNQGAVVSIFVARDLVFDQVYDLRVK